MSLWNLRLRALLHEQFAVVASVLVVLALVGGFATYTAHVDPGTTTEERVVATWESSGAFDHAATVTRGNPLFPVGSELGNRTVYFSTIAPEIGGEYAYSYGASGGGELTTAVEVVLVTRSVDESTSQSGEGTVLWETSRTLGETEAALAPGDSVRAPFSFNASAVEGERGRIEEQLGGAAGTTETFVRATVDVEGTVNGERIDRRRVDTLPMSFEGSTYRVGPAETGRQQFETTRTVTVPRTYGPLRSVGGPLALICSLAGLVALTAGRSRDRLELTDREREWLAYREDRSEFDEWVTTFWLPPEAFDRPEAEAASLADLVDFAIDTDGGVVESPNGSEYYVVHEEFLYTYTAPQPPRRARDAESEADEGPEADTERTSGTDSEGEGEDGGTTDEGADGDPDRESDGDSDRESDGDGDATATRLDAAALDLGVEVSAEENGTSDATEDPRRRDEGDTE